MFGYSIKYEDDKFQLETSYSYICNTLKHVYKTEIKEEELRFLLESSNMYANIIYRINEMVCNKRREETELKREIMKNCLNKKMEK